MMLLAAAEMADGRAVLTAALQRRVVYRGVWGGRGDSSDHSFGGTRQQK